VGAAETVDAVEAAEASEHPVGGSRENEEQVAVAMGAELAYIREQEQLSGTAEVAVPSPMLMEAIGAAPVTIALGLELDAVREQGGEAGGERADWTTAGFSTSAFALALAEVRALRGRACLACEGLWAPYRPRARAPHPTDLVGGGGAPYVMKGTIWTDRVSLIVVVHLVAVWYHGRTLVG
jgi:hypothetical protein